MDGVRKLCDLDIERYSCVSQGIRTSEVIITEERIRYIRERHPEDYERYSRYIEVMVRHPQYILEDPVPNTAVIVQEFCEAGEHFRLVLKLAVTGSREGKKDPVITFMKISAKKYAKYLRNKNILYRSE